MANFNINYLIVAGGGAGGHVGGGGAGGFLTNFPSGSASLSTSIAYSITIGAGGAGSTSAVGASGANSIFNNITATGGGGGGGQGSATGAGDGVSGGSGGGAGAHDNGLGVPGSGNTPATTPSQGNDGGNHTRGATSTRYSGGGGGGAGSAGANAPSWTLAGDGGNGIQNAITGTSPAPYYAGGGGGSSWYYGSGTSAAGTGGSGVGGNGGFDKPTITPATAGATNTGSGGGANGLTSAGYLVGSNGAGGDGIVILRYATADANYTTTGLTPTETIDGTDTILSFTTVGTGSITFTTPPPPPFSGTKVTTPVTDFNKPLTEEGLKIPSGTSLEQPIGVEGMVRNDTNQSSRGSSSAISYYNGTNWRYFENELSTSFNTVLYTGNASTRSITGVGFQPDLVWIKNRDAAYFHGLFDSIRGANKVISSNSTDTENQYGNWTQQLTSFDSDGFSLGNNSDSGNYVNISGNDYVAWCFNAGGLANKSADFNGSNSIVKSTNLGAAFNSQTTLSIAGWFKTSTSTSRMTIASFSNTSVGSTDLWIGFYANENTIAFRNSVEGSPGILQVNDTGGSNLRDGNWHHVVFTADSNGTHVYVDGSQLTGYTYSFGNSSTNIQMPSINQFSIGANQDSSASGGQWFMNGIINQVRVFTSALSASQVTELYNETAADNNVLNYPTSAGCIAAYPLGENANGVDGLYNGSSSNVTFGKPGYLTRNTEGTIESTVSVNNDLGFSIATYTATGVTGTVGHGLDTPPEMIIAKTTNQNYNWVVYHKETGASNYLILNNSNTSASSSAFMNNTSPTSSVFTAGAGQNLNYANGDQIITYNFTSKPNYSKVGSYLGNGNATGPIVTLDFEPAFVMIKGVDQSSNWTILDNKRDTSNPNSARLDADDSMAEYSAVGLMDFNSDGFQIVTTQGSQNAIGKTFIYLAFANTI